MPGVARVFMRANIIGNYIEMVRDVMLVGRLPNILLYLATVIVSVAVFILSYRFFMRYKAIFVDVL